MWLQPKKKSQTGASALMCTRSFIDFFFLSFFVHILSNDKKKKKQINFNLHVPLGKLAENKIKN